MRNGFHASDQSSWKAAVLLGVILVLGGRYAFQRYLDHRLDTAQAEWNAEIEQARALAQAAQLRLTALAKSHQAHRDDRKARDIERIRTEAHDSHQRYQTLLAQAVREREQADQQARLERENAQRTGAIESRNQITALRRALDIPIVRH
ncbi:MAG TPA: hypothetical protein VJ652_21410 [Noviherbaspirillum sp.]|nr:hypothetical protein [Noviherbaspirillum sp.]